jgi:hypothetical protein
MTLRSLIDGVNILQAAKSSETIKAIYHTVRRHIREDGNIWQKEVP